LLVLLDYLQLLISLKEKHVKLCDTLGYPRSNLQLIGLLDAAVFRVDEPSEDVSSSWSLSLDFLLGVFSSTSIKRLI